MNRIIKFRAWDKEENKMLEPIELTKLLKQISNKYDNSIGGDAIRRHDLEWMQYTGLKDKNGKEIYEGDILHRKNRTFSDDPYRDEYALVKWKKEQSGFCGGDSSTPIHYYIDNIKPYLVIGNIFENPELLAQQSSDHDPLGGSTTGEKC